MSGYDEGYMRLNDFIQTALVAAAQINGRPVEQAVAHAIKSPGLSAFDPPGSPRFRVETTEDQCVAFIVEDTPEPGQETAYLFDPGLAAMLGASLMMQSAYVVSSIVAPQEFSAHLKYIDTVDSAETALSSFREGDR